MGTNGRFANSLYELGSAGVFDSTLGSDGGSGVRKSGYVFPVSASGITVTGVNSYYTNETGVLYKLNSGNTSPAGNCYGSRPN